MGKSGNRRRAVARAALGFGLAGIVAACAGPSAPAPVYFGGGEASSSGWRDEPPPRALPAPPPMALPAPRPMLAHPLPPEPPEGVRRILVGRGETLGGIARRYHVSQHAIIAANRLRPPYKIDSGISLVIPGAGEGPLREAALPEPPPRAAPPRAELSPPPPSSPAARQPEMIPLDTPVPPSAGAALDRPAAAPPPPGEPSVAQEARADSASPPAAPALRDGRFPWPVRGRILAEFGAAANGTRNDGINIAAPRGAPVRAIAGGEVAYAGNQVPGYGNLILVKHPGGWISAYAHCADLLVAKGEAVRAGQVIARVGTTGGVTQPQLHFELRRGEHPVDPRDYLAPSPSTAGRGEGKAG